VRAGEGNLPGYSCDGHDQQTGGNADVEQNPLEALTEGTPHRRGKGAGPETRAQTGGESAGMPARERLVEAVGAGRSRTKVKRRKAARAGELASSSEALYPPEPVDVVATGSA